MSRAQLSTLAMLFLVGLTIVTWQLSEADASPWTLAAVATVKIAIVGAVFLELLKAWPVWLLLSTTTVLAVLGGSAWLIG